MKGNLAAIDEYIVPDYVQHARGGPPRQDGAKHSGLGRERGMVALEHYSDYKSVFIAAE